MTFLSLPACDVAIDAAAKHNRKVRVFIIFAVASVTNCQSPIKLVASSLLRDLEIKRTFILKVGFQK